jgi:PAS domain S-box-containing protein
LYLVLTPELLIVGVSEAYLRATMTERGAILGRHLFDVFPDNPDDPTATGVRNLAASLARVLERRTADAMAVQKYDIRRPEAEGGAFEERFWSPVNSPVLAPDGTLAYIIHRVEDVTEFVRLRHRERDQERRADELSARTERVEAELFLRARQLQAANEQLRAANEELRRFRAELERRVEERTAQLTAANAALRAEAQRHARTARELMDKREKLRVTLESIGDAVVTTDTDGRVTMLNRAAEALTGWPGPDAAGVPLGDVFRIVDQRTGARAENPVGRVLAEGVTVGLANHTALIARDGTARPIDDSAAPIRDATGALLGAVLIFRDVSARYAAEASLEGQRRLLRTLIDALPDAIWTTDAAGRFVVSNPAHVALLGAADEAAVAGRTVFDFHPPDPAREHHADDLRVLERGETIFHKEEPVPDAAGRRRRHLVIKAPLRDRDGTVTGLVGVSHDIEERKRAEEALRASEDRFRLLIDVIREYAIFTTDADGRVTTWNAGAERYYGYPAAEALGLSLERFHTPEEVAAGAPAERLQRAAETGSHFVEAWRVRKDGTRFWAEVATTALRAGAGPQGFVVVARDLTERRKLEDQFRQAQKLEAVGRLAGGVAHDFNNLLTVINGYGDLVLGALAPGDPNRDAVAAIRDAGERAAAVTSQLLAFSRKAIVEPKVIDPNAVIDQAYRLLNRLVGEDVLLTTALAPDLYLVKADPTQLEQIVLNLAVNARDAMPTGGRLTIETRNVRLREHETAAYPDLTPGAYVQLAVSDTGSGMTDEVKARIFEPFFTTKEQGKGTGLGLSMVYGAVKTHGGHVSVYSEPNVGSTFKILLPATFEPPAGSRSGERRQGPPRDGNGPPGRGRRDRPPVHPAGAGGARVRGAGRGHRGGRAPDGRGPPRPDPPVPDGRGHARHGRAPTGRSAARRPPRPEGALRQRLHRRRGRAPRHRGGVRRVPPEAVYTHHAGPPRARRPRRDRVSAIPARRTGPVSPRRRASRSERPGSRRPRPRRPCAGRWANSEPARKPIPRPGTSPARFRTAGGRTGAGGPGRNARSPRSLPHAAPRTFSRDRPTPGSRTGGTRDGREPVLSGDVRRGCRRTPHRTGRRSPGAGPPTPGASSTGSARGHRARPAAGSCSPGRSSHRTTTRSPPAGGDRW